MPESSEVLPVENMGQPSQTIPPTSTNANQQGSQKMDPNMIHLAQIIKEGFIQYQTTTIEELKVQVKDRIIITTTISIVILIIILSIVYLTSLGKFEVSTLAFMLGASVGSLLTILGKHLVG